jgi:hypothetical protein
VEHLGDVLVYRVISHDAALVTSLETLRTRDAALNLRACELNEFGLDTFSFKFAERLLNENGGVAVLAGTTVKSDNLH